MNASPATRMVVPPLDQPAKQPGWSRDLAILGMAAFIVFLLIGWHPPIGSAMRYAESAREMATSSDWVVPTLNYVPYFEKPILTYWLGALTQSLFGSSGWAVQLPSFMAGLVSLYATYAFGRFWRNAAFGLAAALFLLFSGQFLVFTTVFTTDPLFSACLILAWYAYFRHEQSPTCRWRDMMAPQLRWLWLFWLALSAAFLTKGPLAIILSGCAIGGYALLSGGLLGVWRVLLRLRPVSGIIIMAAVSAPWHYLVWHRDPRFLEFFYWHINVEAFFDGSINHPGPPYYYIPIIAAALAPWSLMALPMLAMAIRRAIQAVNPRWTAATVAITPTQPDGQAVAPSDPAAVDTNDTYRQGQIFLLSVLGFPLLFLSISASKLGTYAMPLYPALALLVVDQLTRMEARPPLWLRSLLAIQVLLLVVGGIVYVTVFAQPDAFKQVDWAWWPVLAVAITAILISGIWGGMAAARGHLRRGITIIGIGTALAIAAALPNAFHVLKYIDGRTLARTVAARLSPEDHLLLTTGCVHDHSLVWELRRPPGFLGHPRELGMGLYTAATPPGSPWPLEHDKQGNTIANPRTGAPRKLNLYDLLRADAPAQTRLVTKDELTRDWQGSVRLWLFADGDWINPLLDLHLPVYEIGRTDKITLVTNLPLDGLTHDPLTAYRHGLP